MLWWISVQAPESDPVWERQYSIFQYIYKTRERSPTDWMPSATNSILWVTIVLAARGDGGTLKKYYALYINMLGRLDKTSYNDV